jgi:hypothetical protein
MRIRAAEILYEQAEQLLKNVSRHIGRPACKLYCRDKGQSEDNEQVRQLAQVLNLFTTDTKYPARFSRLCGGSKGIATGPLTASPLNSFYDVPSCESGAGIAVSTHCWVGGGEGKGGEGQCFDFEKVSNFYNHYIYIYVF